MTTTYDGRGGALTSDGLAAEAAASASLEAGIPPPLPSAVAESAASGDIAAAARSAPRGRHVPRLGLAHFAHLRAVVEGLDVEDAAQRYLAADTRPTARAAHAEVVQLLRAIVRRRGDSRWRLLSLIGRVLIPVATVAGEGMAAPAAPRPTLAQWAEARGLDVDEWGERELIELYQADCPPDRKAARAVRLRERLRGLLRELEPVAAEPALPSDLIEGWFDAVTAERLRRAGLLRLDELQRRIARGARWYLAVPATGATKAKRIAAYLALLLPAPPAQASAVAFYASLLAPSAPIGPSGNLAITSKINSLPQPAVGRATLLPAELDGSHGTNRASVASAGLQASNDREAIEAWLVAKAGQPGEEGFVRATAKSYRVEAERLLLWCIAERQRPLSSVTAEDCAAYKAFLAAIPEAWISRRRAVRYGPGWTPFAVQLTVDSQQHALKVVGALFRWLVAARYLEANPWLLLKTRLGDDPHRSVLDSRAFTPAAWQAIEDYVLAQPPSPAQARAEFVVHFVEGVGLRADEFVAGELAQFRLVDGDWVMQIHGKGARNRLASVPPQSVRALNKYLAYRGLPPLGVAPANTPLVASVTDPVAPVGYRALYDSMKLWFRRAIEASSLSPGEQDVARRASLHWLRHTCGTRALERGVDLPDIQGQFGQADPRTAMRYSKKQLQRRQDAFGRAFG